MNDERLSLKLLEEPAKVLALDETFIALHDLPAWRTLVAILDGEWLRQVRLGLAEYDKPAEVAFKAGFVAGLEAIMKLPAQVKTLAREMRKAKADEEKREKEEEEARKVPRFTVTP